MTHTIDWQGEARLTFGDALETRVRAALFRNGGPAGWSGEVVIEGAAPITPGDRVELTIGRSPCRALVRGAAIRGGAGHRTTSLLIDGDGPPPAPLARR